MNHKVDNYKSILPPPELIWTCVCFSQAWELWAKCLENSVSSSKITIAQLAAIQALFYNERAMSPTEISHVIPIETHSTSQLIDRLHQRKLVTRRRSQNDRRAVEVELTEQGLQLIAGALPEISKVMKNVFGSFTEKERENLVELLRKVAYAAADHLGANKEHLDENAKILSGRERSNPSSKKAATRKAKRRTLK